LSTISNSGEPARCIIKFHANGVERNLNKNIAKFSIIKHLLNALCIPRRHFGKRSTARLSSPKSELTPKSKNKLCGSWIIQDNRVKMMKKTILLIFLIIFVWANMGISVERIECRMRGEFYFKLHSESKSHSSTGCCQLPAHTSAKGIVNLPCCSVSRQYEKVDNIAIPQTRIKKIDLVFSEFYFFEESINSPLNVIPITLSSRFLSFETLFKHNFPLLN
jgi:hypothetical protein